MCKEYGDSAPDFKIDSDAVFVTFYPLPEFLQMGNMKEANTQKNYVENEKTREKSEEFREKILNLIVENKCITILQLAEKLSINKKGVEWQLKQLKSQNLIRRVGADKGGYWEIVGEDNV